MARNGKALPPAARKLVGAALTPSLNTHFETYLKKAGVSWEEWLEICRYPETATRLRRTIEQRLEAALILVHDTLLEKALMGDVAAIKLFMQKFDKDFVERTEKKGEGPELPDFDTFERAMTSAYGRERWKAAQALAEQDGKKGGVFGENYLPGGSRDEEEQVIDVEARSVCIHHDDDEPEAAFE